MTQLEIMQSEKLKLITDLKNHVEKDELDLGEKKSSEIKDLERKINLQMQVDEAQKPVVNTVNKVAGENKIKKNASFIRAALKKVTGGNLTEVENALLLPSTTFPNGENGEGYILPQDIQTTIRKKLREYKSMRSVLGLMKTTALKGSFPVESLDSLVGLVDFEDGTDGKDNTDIKFTVVNFALSEKAAFIKLSNTLLALTDNDLIGYIVEIFTKKALITENKMAIDTLKNGKTVKAIEDWKALKSSINVDLDPAALYGTKIITNQDGFDVLDNALDDFGRPILQPNPAQPTQRLFMGYPVEVFSNSQLPSVAKKAPIIYGNIAEGAKFVDLDMIAFTTSQEAGFYSNTTVARLIEFVTTVQCDASDKCYIYGEIPLTVGA